MLKAPDPVTLDDLEATAKDDRHGTCGYRSVKVYWDDATNSFNYWIKGARMTKPHVEAFLTGYN